MAELGVDMSEAFPKPLTDEVVRAADVVITMGCGDACPIYPGKRYEDWELDDPAGQDLDARPADPRRDRRRASSSLIAELPRRADRPRARRADASPRALGDVRARLRRLRRDHGRRRRRGALGHVGVAIAFGLVIMAMIYAVGHRLGRSLQPRRDVRLRRSRGTSRGARGRATSSRSWSARAAARSLLGWRWDGTSPSSARRIPSLGTGQAFLWEVVLTAFLMFVILAVATDTRAVGEAAAIAIGGTVALDALFGGGVSGASINPARSFGPALVASSWTDFWVYVVGPAAGALAGALLYQVVRGETPMPD